MVSIKTLRKLALSFPETTEEPHFEKTSFKVKKKIFATYDDVNKRACIKLSEIDQDVFSSADKTIIFPVDNKWGKQGWTLIEMSKVRKKLFVDALITAYCVVAPKKLSELLRPNSNEKKIFNKMKKIKLDHNIKIIFVTAKSYPMGIGDAHKKLHELVPFSATRNYFGLSRPENENYDIIYRAGAEEIEQGEAQKLNLKTLMIKKGNYISIIVNDYKKDVMSIDRAFQQLLKQPNLHPEGYCVEWYATDKEAVNCMIRLNE